jgi:predicted alpha/beta hydrolase family esterase
MSKQKKVLVLHGWGGSDMPHWQSDVASKIAQNYGTVSFPLLDNPHFPSKNRWLKQLKMLLKDFEPDIVMCHSLGNTLWFHLCLTEELTEIKHLLLVAPPRLDCDVDTIKTFFPCEIPNKLFAKEITLVTSKTDPYLTHDEALKIALAIQPQEHLVLDDAGHINESSGYGAWKWVENYIEKRIYLS